MLSTVVSYKQALNILLVVFCILRNCHVYGVLKLYVRQSYPRWCMFKINAELYNMTIKIEFLIFLRFLAFNWKNSSGVKKNILKCDLINIFMLCLLCLFIQIIQKYENIFKQVKISIYSILFYSIVIGFAIHAKNTASCRSISICSISLFISIIITNVCYCICSFSVGIICQLSILFSQIFLRVLVSRL